MRIIVSLVAVMFALIIGASFGFKYIFAPLLGLMIYRWGIASMRSFASGSGSGMISDTGEPMPLAADERTLYWCETCGTELLLLVRGSGNPPRHCAERMHERAEIGTA